MVKLPAAYLCWPQSKRNFPPLSVVEPLNRSQSPASSNAGPLPCTDHSTAVHRVSPFAHPFPCDDGQRTDLGKYVAITYRTQTEEGYDLLFTHRLFWSVTLRIRLLGGWLASSGSLSPKNLPKKPKLTVIYIMNLTHTTDLAVLTTWIQLVLQLDYHGNPQRHSLVTNEMVPTVCHKESLKMNR